MLPESTKRVPKHTAAKVNEEIRQNTIDHIANYRNVGPEEIGRRIAELDNEWDIERFLQALPAGMVLLGIGLGAWLNKKWLIFPAVVSAFLLQHAMQGWCPPLPVLRRLGVRTPHEIEQERYALKAIRGDFGENGRNLEKIVQAVELH